MADKLIIRSRAGIKKGELYATSAGDARGGFLSLVCAPYINAAGSLQFTLHGNNGAIDSFETDGQIEYWRDTNRQQPFFRGLYQGPNYATDQNYREVCTATCVGEKHLLSRAAVLWAAKTINRTSFVATRAESMMKTLVRYNLTADASTENGRIVSHPERRITIQADSGYGTELTKDITVGKNVLEALQEIAVEGQVDFDLVKIDDQQWDFRVYPLIGVDRTKTMLFSYDRGNIGQIVYDKTSIDTKNIVVVGGDGEEDRREFVSRIGPDYSTEQHREIFLSSSGETSTAAMQQQGDKQLDILRVKPRLTFQALQGKYNRFDVDYNLGDLVSASYRDIQNAPYQVVGATIILQPGTADQITVELEQQ